MEQSGFTWGVKSAFVFGSQELSCEESGAVLGRRVVHKCCLTCTFFEGRLTRRRPSRTQPNSAWRMRATDWLSDSVRIVCYYTFVMRLDESTLLLFIIIWCISLSSNAGAERVHPKQFNSVIARLMCNAFIYNDIESGGGGARADALLLD